ncbi:transporter [Lactococcus hodotermopsidis]|uniref:Transporter n=1 Tax=Pseudolactococcus hodotermopsidis TaxID=2709157 RepID=A0A6A0BF52_9LACT|nr:ABC transporter permease [Lactococcus hodotermopsidis]GFH43406.1 transporter [Lactococcus hodotermopsidis]
MNFFKRAICSVTRQKSKSLILFAVIFLLGNILAGSVIIQQSTQNVEKTTKAKMGAIATIDIDYNDKKVEEAMNSGGFIPAPLSEELIQKLGSSPYVKTYDYSQNYGFQSGALKTYDPQANKEDDSGNNMQSSFSMAGNYFQVHGVQDPKVMDISLGKIKLAQGSVFTADDIKKGNKVVMISKQLADENGLHVGDEMTLDNCLTDETGQPKDKSYDVKAKIVGTYEVMEAPEKKSNKNSGMTGMLDFEKYNTIYMPNVTVASMTKGYLDFMRVEQPSTYQEITDGMPEEAVNKSYFTPVFQLKTVDNVDKFKDEVKPLLPKYYSVMASTDDFEKSASQFTKLSQISKAVIVAAIILSIVLILLVILLFMRDRKRELGIYLSLGDKKLNVIMQIMIEVLAVALVALLLSLVTGKFLGSFASNVFLSSDAGTTTDNVTNGMFVNNALTSLNAGIDAETIANNYAVTFTPFYIVTYLLAGLGTVIVSVLLSTLYIFKLKPKKILLG